MMNCRGPGAGSVEVVSEILKAAFEKASTMTPEAELEALARWLVDAQEQDNRR